MINTIIFDFGDVLINTDKATTIQTLKKLGLKEWNTELSKLTERFEKGKITEAKFLSGFQKHIPNASLDDIRSAWRKFIADFPLKRLEFLQNISNNYRLFILSNADMIHVDEFEYQAGSSFFGDFYRCFEKVYYSFEIGKRTPDSEAFSYVINKHDLSPKRTLFVDDKLENIEAAKALGLKVWHLKVGEEDVTELFSKKIIRV